MAYIISLDSGTTSVRALLYNERGEALGMAQQETLEDHRAISAAILAGDRESALRHLETHLNRYRDNLRLLEEKFPEYFSLG